MKNLPKRASLPIEKLLASAVSNAKQAGVNETDLYVENVTVNEGIVMKRSMPRARGSASRINKRTSHIMLTLVDKGADTKVKKEVKKEKVVKEKVEKTEKKEKKAVTKSKTTKKVEDKA